MYNLLEGERVILKTDGELTVPDMDGWSLRDVMKVAKIADLKLNTVGSGYVAKQNLKAGSALRKGDYLIVELERLLRNITRRTINLKFSRKKKKRCWIR